MLKAISVLFVLVAAAAMCQAQYEVATDLSVSYSILDEADVIKELKITPSQETKIKAELAIYQNKIQEGFNDLINSGTEVDNIEQAITKISTKEGEKFRKKLTAILSAEQLKRFDQVEFQLAGPTAFLRDSVNKQMHLKPEQMAKVKKLVADINAFTADMVGGGQEIDTNGGVGVSTGPVDSKKLAEKYRKAMEEIKKMLTPEQLATMQKLAGPEFSAAK